MIDQRRRASFDAVAEAYHAIRPSYPDAVIDEVVRWSGITPANPALEVGCGTGKASLKLAARDLQLTCLEPGPQLAAVARRALADFPKVRVQEGRFEDAPLPGGYGLIAAAQSFHWIDPEVGFARAAELLRPGGTLALFWNQLDHAAQAPDDYFARNMPIYERIAPELAQHYAEQPPRVESIAARQAELRDAGRFAEVALFERRWSRRYTTEEYLALLDTYSDHRVLDDDVRARLFASLKELIDDAFDGAVLKPYVTVLHLARTPS